MGGSTISRIPGPHFADYASVVARLSAALTQPSAERQLYQALSRQEEWQKHGQIAPQAFRVGQPYPGTGAYSLSATLRWRRSCARCTERLGLSQAERQRPGPSRH